MSQTLMREGRPSVRSFEPGEVVTLQGEPVEGLFVVLDGMLSVEVDGREVGDVGPGAVIGERAALEGGTRTATLRATTPVKAAFVDAAAVSEGALRDLTEGRRREGG
jgi:CRP-like cAMP-binding protein